MLKLHPRERKPEMVDKIMRAIQLILDTFADYPLGLVIYRGNWERDGIPVYWERSGSPTVRPPNGSSGHKHALIT